MLPEKKKDHIDQLNKIVKEKVDNNPERQEEFSTISYTNEECIDSFYYFSLYQCAVPSNIK